MIEKGAVFPMFYLPPVSYFTGLINHGRNILVEKEEHFPKQTYRNRSHIYTPDGVLALTVPVVKGAKNHTKVKDVRISYDFNWQRLHWLSLQACYRRSAYFEYYEDELAPFYEKKYGHLFDYNQQLLHFVLRSAKISIDINYTESYEAVYPHLADYRHAFDPKQETNADQKSYFQVFGDRKGFLRDISIADLLFNQGPNTADYL